MVRNRSLTPSPANIAERVTDTGWRVKGTQANALIDQASRLVPPLDIVHEDIVLAMQLHARKKLGSGSPVPAILDSISSEIAKIWEDSPPLTTSSSLDKKEDRFSGLRWRTIGDGTFFKGELLWRHKHPVLSGVPCTTHLLIVEQGPTTTLSIQVSAERGYQGVRGNVGAGQLRPTFLTALNESVRLQFKGKDTTPLPLPADRLLPFVNDELLSPNRDVPIAVLTPIADSKFAVDPDILANELIGLAQLRVIQDHDMTFELTELLEDRRLSCYWGALRIYMPGLTTSDRPSDHPLLVKDQVIDPVLRADLVGKIAMRSRRTVRIPTPLSSPTVPHEPEQASPTTTTRDTTPSTLQAPAQHESLESERLLRMIVDQLRQLNQRIDQLIGAQQSNASDIESMRTNLAVRGSGMNTFDRRLGSIEQLLSRHFEPDETPATSTPETISNTQDESESDESAPIPLADIVRDATDNYIESLLILESADKSAQESKYQDTERVASVLDAMAHVSKRRQAGVLGTSLKEAFRELGVTYRGGISESTSKRLRQQYLAYGPDGQEYECHEHIVLGASYDPKHCLRIYFTSRAANETRFVIGHIGRHLIVESST